eukprot:gene5777-1030_t
MGDDCVFSSSHAVVGYRTEDFVRFEPLGVVFDAGAAPPLQDVIMFRPHVLHCPADDRFVMWYKVTGKVTPRTHRYGVATAASPAGPFTVEVDKVPGSTLKGGDHYLFSDPGTPDAYFVQYGSVQKLNASYTGVEGPVARLPTPYDWEAPVMFKGTPGPGGGPRYFVLGGHNCCACLGGSNAALFTAIGSPLGNWTMVSDLGDNTTQCALQPEGCYRGGHSPYQWIDHSQTAAAFSVVQAGHTAPTTVLLSNQWATAPEPARARNQDLLYWDIVRYGADGLPLHFEWNPHGISFNL